MIPDKQAPRFPPGFKEEAFAKGMTPEQYFDYWNSKAHEVKKWQETLASLGYKQGESPIKFLARLNRKDIPKK